MSFLEAALVYVVAAPGVVFGVLALLWLLGWSPSERLLWRITASVFSTCVLLLAIMIWTVLGSGTSSVVVAFGNWLSVGNYHFPLVLMADRLSLPFLAITAVLSGLIGQFSATYLHREPGFLRFFLFLHLFAFGSLLAFAAGSFDLLIAGWEIVGITSVLLVAFFHRRPAPVDNGLRMFGVYRACDIGLLVGAIALHLWAGTASFAHGFPALSGTNSAIFGMLVLLAAAGKAAQVPFSGWLPRAMEGPTPSSAIFYGAISIHAGAYLLLRIQPVLSQAPLVSALIFLLGVATAFYGTIVGRASADAKTSLAFASLTQVGIVFAEIAMGWNSIAVTHILGHALIRTLQFLRAPSMLHDYHQMHSAAGGDVPATGKHFTHLFSERSQLWLFRWALDRGHLDTILDRWLLSPLMRISRAFARLDRLGLREAAGHEGHEISVFENRPARGAGEEGPWQ